MILRRFDPLSCSLKRVPADIFMLASMNKTKDQISWVSSHDLCWENKMYKRKRSIEARTFVIWHGWVGGLFDLITSKTQPSHIMTLLTGNLCNIQVLIFFLPCKLFPDLSKLSLYIVATRLNKHSDVFQNNWNCSRINQLDCKRLYRWLLLSFCNSSLKHFFCVFLIRIKPEKIYAFLEFHQMPLIWLLWIQSCCFAKCLLLAFFPSFGRRWTSESIVA